MKVEWDVTLYTDKKNCNLIGQVSLSYGRRPKGGYRYSSASRSEYSEGEEVGKYQGLALEVKRIHTASKLSVVLKEECDIKSCKYQTS